MAINPQYLVAAVDLSEVFLDKDTGQPLSGGQISFYRDVDRVTPKLVYTIQNNNPALPPTYTFIPLPNPITLSASGQFQDNNGNNIPIYYYPVTGINNTVDLYYIVVTSSQGTQQFTRQAWPPNESSIQPLPGLNVAPISNQITNSQFVDVNFIPPGPVTYTFPAAQTTTINIAPGWNLVATSNAANATVSFQRTAIQGSNAFPNNPPYTLTITPSLAGITSLQLIQTFQNNPDVFSPPPLGANGFISASILIVNGSGILSMTYQPNGQPSQQIMGPQNNISGAPIQYNQTTQLQPATNGSTGDTGTVNIIINLPFNAATTISNVQIVPLNSNITNIPYDQRTSNRERDFEFNVYQQPLFYKPIPSFLIGWDFPLNPAQFLGNSGGPFATGANTSNYVWDQTIIFQTANNGFTFARGAAATGSSGLSFSIAANSSIAVIQYADQSLMKKITNNVCSVSVQGTCSAVNSCQSTISLWVSSSANLPNMGANASLVATLSAAGKPLTFNNVWTEIPRGNLGDATFFLNPAATKNFTINGYTGWEFSTDVTSNASNWFAIVVGLVNTTNAALGVVLESISLVPGSIPTIPASQTKDEVRRECTRFWTSSFAIGTVPAQAATQGTGEEYFPATSTNPTACIMANVRLPAMRATPNIVTYNPVNANAQVYNISTASDFSGTTALNISSNGFHISSVPPVGSVVGATGAVHWSADSRYGIV